MSSEKIFRPDEVEVQTIYLVPEGANVFEKDEPLAKLAEEMGGSWWFQESGPYNEPDQLVERRTGFFFSTMPEAQAFGVRAMLELGLRISYPAPQPMATVEE